MNVEQLIRSCREDDRMHLEEQRMQKAHRRFEESASAFERWCDNHMIEMLKPQKYEAFSVRTSAWIFDRKRWRSRPYGLSTDRKTERFSDEAIRKDKEMYV